MWHRLPTSIAHDVPQDRFRDGGAPSHIADCTLCHHSFQEGYCNWLACTPLIKLHKHYMLIQLMDPCSRIAYSKKSKLLHSDHACDNRTKWKETCCCQTTWNQDIWRLNCLLDFERFVNNAWSWPKHKGNLQPIMARHVTSCSCRCCGWSLQNRFWLQNS